MSFFSSFLPAETSGGGCFGEPRGANVGDVLGEIGGMFGLGSVWTSVGTSSFSFSFAKGYRPRDWDMVDPVQMVLVRSNIGGLFFDAIMTTETEETLTITSHPVQNGANIADHAYREPTRITMEIFMSDVMQARYPGQFNEFLGKSVSAYRRLLDLQRARIPFTVQTRLGSYQNMLIENITAPDDVSTKDGLRCTVTMREVLVAKVSTVKVSAREWVTGSTKRGPVEPKEKPSTGIAVITGRGTGGSQGVWPG